MYSLPPFLRTIDLISSILITKQPSQLHQTPPQTVNMRFAVASALALAGSALAMPARTFDTNPTAQGR